MDLSPLSELLSSRSQVAVLRALLENKRPMTGREISRMAGVSPQRAHDALNVLEHLHVVSWRPAGRAQLYSVSQESELVRKILAPLFRSEKEYEERLKEAILRAVGPNVLSVVLFGSTARGDAEPGSDLDLLVVTQTKTGAAEIEDRIFSAVDELGSSFHAYLSPIISSLEELRERQRRKIGWIQSAIEEGMTLYGKPLRELLNAA